MFLAGGWSFVLGLSGSFVFGLRVEFCFRLEWEVCVRRRGRGVSCLAREEFRE